MSTPTPKPIRSPSYPSLSLGDAVAHVRKIEHSYRLSQVDREAAAKLIGYAGLSGPANHTLAALAQYGLVERAGKGEMRVTSRAQAILHPNDDGEKRQALASAAVEPSLFRELRERWPNMIPPEDGIVTYLNRQGFNQSAIRPATKAYLQTLQFLEESGANESHGAQSRAGAESKSPKGGEVPATAPITYGGANVGDFVQWEVNDVLQLERPMRVRLVSADGQFVAVDGSTTGIPMNQVIVEERGAHMQPQTPMFPLGLGEVPTEMMSNGETEWMRNRLGGGTGIRLLVTGDMGPKQIGKLIKLLEAQRAVLEDEDDEDSQ